jgi:hypothetical protein
MSVRIKYIMPDVAKVPIRKLVANVPTPTQAASIAAFISSPIFESFAKRYYSFAQPMFGRELKRLVTKLSAGIVPGASAHVPAEISDIFADGAEEPPVIRTIMPSPAHVAVITLAAEIKYPFNNNREVFLLVDPALTSIYRNMLDEFQVSEFRTSPEFVRASQDPSRSGRGSGTEAPLSFTSIEGANLSEAALVSLRNQIQNHPVAMVICDLPDITTDTHVLHIYLAFVLTLRAENVAVRLSDKVTPASMALIWTYCQQFMIVDLISTPAGTYLVAYNLRAQSVLLNDMLLGHIRALLAAALAGSKDTIMPVYGDISAEYLAAFWPAFSPPSDTNDKLTADLWLERYGALADRLLR